MSNGIVLDLAPGMTDYSCVRRSLAGMKIITVEGRYRPKTHAVETPSSDQ